jgi:hypothetical protein
VQAADRLVKQARRKSNPPAPAPQQHHHQAAPEVATAVGHASAAPAELQGPDTLQAPVVHHQKGIAGTKRSMADSGDGAMVEEERKASPRKQARTAAPTAEHQQQSMAAPQQALMRSASIAAAAVPSVPQPALPG